MPIRDGGVYGHVDGPRFNTRAEIRGLAACGVTHVSQTGGPEAVLCGEAELPYALLGYATDYANGVKDEATPVQTLLDMMAASTATFAAVLARRAARRRRRPRADRHGLSLREQLADDAHGRAGAARDDQVVVEERAPARRRPGARRRPSGRAPSIASIRSLSRAGPSSARPSGLDAEQDLEQVALVARLLEAAEPERAPARLHRAGCAPGSAS